VSGGSSSVIASTHYNNKAVLGHTNNDSDHITEDIIDILERES
jgi:hypothetical protein